MAIHNFWGCVAPDHAGFSSEKEFFLPGFQTPVTIFLGPEFDDDGEEVETPPTTAQLDEYAQTFQQYLTGADAILTAIKEAAFACYQKLYAHYYEDESQSGEPPLGIDTAEKHFEYMKDLIYVRMLDEGAMQLPVYYEKIDAEHGLEIKLVHGEVADIGGIAET